MAEGRIRGRGVIRTVFDTAIGWFGLNDLFKPFFKQDRLDKIGEDSAKHRQSLEHYIFNLKPEIRRRLYRRFKEAGNRENRLVSVLGGFIEDLDKRLVSASSLKPHERERGRILIRGKLKEIAYLGDKEFNQFFEMLNNDWLRQWLMGFPGDIKEFLVEGNKAINEGLGPVNDRFAAWRKTHVDKPFVPPVPVTTRRRNKRITQAVLYAAIVLAIIIGGIAGIMP